ncbi:MAG: phosphoglucosamine mutase [Microthrixaceae bacterium]
MAVRFGTDGVRGVANRDLTPEIALAIGRAAVRVFGTARVLVGRDTRRSGPMFESAVAAGIAAEGAEAVLLGVVPTPAVALAAAHHGVAGVMISASHNPFADNGIKVFAPGGLKLDDAEQARVEAAIAEVLEPGPHAGPEGAAVGSVSADPDALGRYGRSVADAMEGRTLQGLHVVVDCANGSDSEVAPEVLRSLGARVDVLADGPDGANINLDCGSTHPEALQDAVVRLGADVGIAFDGDADRVLAVDHLGRLVDGDQIMALCATDLRDRGRLAHDTVVVTVMSNLGFRRAMAVEGITVVETAVGDRYVLEAMAAGGYSLGGEQSGHVVFGDLCTTGDGLLTAVMLLDLVRRAGSPLASLAEAAMTRLPQVLVNVRLDRPVPDVAARLAGEVAAAEEELGDNGRVLLRPSGTEPVVRVMVEAPTEETAGRVAHALAGAVAALGD